MKVPSDSLLNYHEIEKLEGWGDTSIGNLKKAVDKAKIAPLNRFIYSIGIRHIGQENAKILSGFFTSIEKFSDLFIQSKRKDILKNLNDLDGIGETQIKSLETFFLNSKNFLKMELKSY